MLAKEVLKILESAGMKASEDSLEHPKEAGFGDLALPCFDLAKKEGKPAEELAREIAKRVEAESHRLISKVEAKNGYVNFFFRWKELAEKILRPLVEVSKLSIGKGKRIMVEYSQPNPVHSMHVGHSRGTFIGDALANLHDFLGYEVIRANYMNDMGLQVAKLVTAYLLWHKGEKPKGKPDFWLWQIYVEFHEKVKEKPELEEKAREVLRKYEIEQDKEIVDIWDRLVGWCIDGFKETYKKLGINFDVYFFESKSRELGKQLCLLALKSGIAFKQEGAIIANLEKHGLPNTVMLRSDGTGLYLTSDLGLSVQKFEKYKLDKSVWVVSSQQSLYFKQLFKILELLGYGWYKNCYHCSFEHITLPEGKMSSREGRAILLDEVIEKLLDKARDEVIKRNPGLDEATSKEIARKIGIGALKYNVLCIQPDDSIVFNWDRMLSLGGRTAAYIQYAHTRCLGILNRAKEFEQTFTPQALSREEKELLRILSNFLGVVEKASKELKPYYLANYVYELATAFNDFYEKTPVLKASENVRNFRLCMVKAVERVLRTGLKLLGIDVPGKM